MSQKGPGVIFAAKPATTTDCNEDQEERTKKKKGRNLTAMPASTREVQRSCPLTVLAFSKKKAFVVDLLMPWNLSRKTLKRASPASCATKSKQGALQTSMRPSVEKFTGLFRLASENCSWLRANSDRTNSRK